MFVIKIIWYLLRKFNFVNTYIGFSFSTACEKKSGSLQPAINPALDVGVSEAS